MQNWVKRVRKGSRDLILEFKAPSISQEQLELETSNLACRFITRGTNDRNKKLDQKGSGREIGRASCRERV